MKKESLFELYVDGASKNNPGQAGAGIYITKDDKELIKASYYLGIKTNNQAEYLALLLGLLLVKDYIKEKDKLEIRSDSLLLVKQVTQEYKVSNPILYKLNKEIKNILDKLNYNIVHVLRDKNKIADKLANLAVEKKIEIPKNLKEKIETI